MNAKLRQKAKINFEKDFFKFMINAVFGKTLENMKKHRNMKVVTTKKEGFIYQYHNQIIILQKFSQKVYQ